MTDRRLTQQGVEVGAQDTAVLHRFTQEAVESGSQATGASLILRLTQEVVEVGAEATGASLTLRLTQIVVEVGSQLIPDVFPSVSDPVDELLWSPAFNSDGSGAGAAGAGAIASDPKHKMLKVGLNKNRIPPFKTFRRA